MPQAYPSVNDPSRNAVKLSKKAHSAKPGGLAFRFLIKYDYVIMKYIRQIIIILFISFLGEILNHLIPLPVPASIYGIIIMFAALVSGILKTESVKETSHFLIDIMPIMFVAPAVGLIEASDLISGSLVQYLVLIIASTILVMGITGRITQRMLTKTGEKGGADHA